MKKYMTPSIKIDKFISEHIVTVSGADNGYVANLQSVENKGQVNLTDMKKVVKFIL